MMRIEFVHDVTFVARLDGAVCQINLLEWEKLGALERRAVLEGHAGLLARRMEDASVFESYDSSGEGVSVAQRDWASEVDQLRAERVQMQKEIEMVGGEYARFRNKVAEQIYKGWDIPKWQVLTQLRKIVEGSDE